MKSIGAERSENFEDVIFKDSKLRFPDNDFMQRSCDYLGKGCYYKSLQQVEKSFPRKQLLLLPFDELKKNPVNLANKVFDFMELKNVKVDPNSERNKSRKIKYIWLASFFGGHNKSLIKKLFSNILPREIKSKIIRNIKSFNKTEKLIPKIDPKVREKLAKYYIEQNKLLFENYGFRY